MPLRLTAAGPEADQRAAAAVRVADAVALWRDDVELFKRKIRINALRENGYHRALRLAHADSLLRDEILN